MSWKDNLEGKTLVVACSKAKRLKVVAGPGTGKSFCMKRRVARLLEEGMPPEEILAVTFTRTAAASLLADLHSLGLKECHRVRVGTLHAFCYSVLMKNSVLMYLDRFPNPIITFLSHGVLQFQGSPLIQDLNNVTHYGRNREKTKRIRAFEAAWARLQSDQAGWPKSTVDKEFEKILISWLRFHKAMLIGEVIPLTLRYLRNNPNADELSNYKHVIVDEYQDLNKAEQELIDLIGNKSSIAIVGDPDQSIYKFRYANPEGIVEFSKRHIGTDENDLDECIRCPTKIVEIANHLILYNHKVGTPHRLTPKKGNLEGTVHILQWNELVEENKGITKYVKHLIESNKYLAKDILILSPRKQIGCAIRDSLVKNGIPSYSFFNEELLFDQFSQEGLTILALLADKEDRVALRFWLGLGSPSWNEGEYRILRNYCEKNATTPCKTLQMIVDSRISIGKIPKITKRFGILLKKLELLHDLSGFELVDNLFPANKKWAEGLREASLVNLDKETTPQDLLGQLRTIITQPEIPEEPDFVRVMSLHKSKGLTSKVTIVVGIIQGLVPLLQEEGPVREKEESLEEQRRVFYVAITRSTDILILSSVKLLKRDLAYTMRAKIHKGIGAYGQVIMSQFVDELGPKSPVQIGLEWQKAGYK